MEGWGPGYDANNDPAWLVHEVANTGSFGWEAINYINCSASHPTGLFLTEVDLGLSLMGGAASPAVFSTPRMYMPAEADIGNAGSWNYNYSTSIDLGMGAMSVSSSGTYEEIGFESVTLFDGSRVNAWHVQQTYNTQLSGSLPQSFEGTIDSWWVDGLGLVKEVNLDNTGSTFMTRELTGYSGL